jgi:hypothetical protein
MPAAMAELLAPEREEGFWAGVENARKLFMGEAGGILEQNAPELRGQDPPGRLRHRLIRPVAQGALGKATTSSPRPWATACVSYVSPPSHRPSKR